MTPDIPIFQEMSETIQETKEYAASDGDGIDTGFEKINEALDGIRQGLILISGQPNTGKSALCLQMGWNIARLNQQITDRHPFRTYVLYFSLDDGAHDLLPRIVAAQKRLKINFVANPHKYMNATESALTRREEGYNELMAAVNCFKLIDKRKGDTVEFVKAEIERHYNALQEIDPRYKLVVCIDNFHDLYSSDRAINNDSNRRYEYCGGILDGLVVKYSIPVICTAQLRKLNGTRRPTMEDVRETTTTAFDAKAILSCYNEVGLKGNLAKVYWLDGTTQEHMPVLEVKLDKNKMSSFKGRLFLEFHPDMSLLIEPSAADSQLYMQAVMS